MSKIEFASPHMSVNELALLDKYIPRGGKVLEFGSGGSTPYFFNHGVSKLVSVESDKEYLMRLGQHPDVRLCDWLPIHADIGDVDSSNWGVPLDTRPQKAWLNYHQTCWQKMPDKHFDLILVDGRFRVASACQSIIHCANCDFTLLVHDFMNRLKLYAPILVFFKLLEHADTSAVFKLKENYDPKMLGEVIGQYKYIFG